MAGVMLQVIPSFYTIFSKNSLSISANTYEKCIESKDYCFARHDDKVCFVLICRYHIILKRHHEEFLQNSDAVCCNYQHVHSLYLIFKNRFTGKNFSFEWTTLWQKAEGSSNQPPKHRSG